MSAHECWWAPMAPWRHAHDCFWALMSAYCSMAPGSWVFMDTHECSLAFRNTHGCFWVLISAHECQWILMRTRDSSWKAVRRSHEHSWPSGHGAMSTHESSKTVMSIVPWGHGHSFHISPNNKKLDIFKICTKWAVENVQDGISMPIGSLEIQKTKVYTVLWDTLY